METKFENQINIVEFVFNVTSKNRRKDCFKKFISKQSYLLVFFFYLFEYNIFHSFSHSFFLSILKLFDVIYF